MSNTTTYYSAFLTGTNALTAMLESNSQGKCLTVLRDALIELGKLPDQKNAAAGFVAALSVPIIECQKRPERESQLDNEAMQNELGRMFSEMSSSYTGGETTHCPDCGEPTKFLNVERNHFEFCPECKKYSQYGVNLHSAWRDETPEIWSENQKKLDGMTLRTPPPFEPDDDIDWSIPDDQIPF